MNLLSHTLIYTLLSLTFINAEEPDLINFENDDTLHGKFIGFTTSGKIIWKNDSAEKNIAFATQDVRKVLLKKGQRSKPFTHTSYVSLKNLDTIPGKIVSLTDEQLTLETDFAGKIRIPKDKIFDININPKGHKIIYRGPFSDQEKWEIKFPANRIVRNPTEQEKENNLPWKFKNFGLNHQGDASSVLMKADLPDKYRITFNSFSSQNYHPSLILMADLKIPGYDEDDSALKKNRNLYKTSLANYLGSSLAIKLRPNRSSISYSGFKENGALFQTTLSNMVHSRSNTEVKTKTFYDLRVDKKSGLILLYANKRMIGKWQIDSLTEQLHGSHFGFSMQYRNNNKSVISDIVMSTWNGVQDSALSLEDEMRDIVMLSNGTDRYSGKITSIKDSKINLKSTYADLAIPQDQVSTVTFARKKTEQPESRDKLDVAVRFYGTGRIIGTLTKADDETILLESKILGKIKIKSEFITSFEFVDIDYAYELFK